MEMAEMEIEMKMKKRWIWRVVKRSRLGDVALGGARAPRRVFTPELDFQPMRLTRLEGMIIKTYVSH